MIRFRTRALTAWLLLLLACLLLMPFMQALAHVLLLVVLYTSPLLVALWVWHLLGRLWQAWRQLQAVLRARKQLRAKSPEAFK